MIDSKVTQAIADDLSKKWCQPGRGGGGVSIDNGEDYCQFTVTIADSLVRSRHINMILKAALFEHNLLIGTGLPCYIFVIRLIKGKIKLTCTEDGVALFTRESTIASNSVKDVIMEISRMMAFSYLPNIWNNKESANLCQPLKQAYTHIWWRLWRTKQTKIRIDDENSLRSNTPSIFQLGSNGLKELLYNEFHLIKSDNIVINEFARYGSISLTAGNYKFYFACFQISPSHATVFYIARKQAKYRKFDKEEYRVFSKYGDLINAIPYIVNSMGLHSIMPGFKDFDYSAGNDEVLACYEDSEIEMDVEESASSVLDAIYTNSDDADANSNFYFELGEQTDKYISFTLVEV